jgi:hypothetical protein
MNVIRCCVIECVSVMLFIISLIASHPVYHSRFHGASGAGGGVRPEKSHWYGWLGQPRGHVLHECVAAKYVPHSVLAQGTQSSIPVLPIVSQSVSQSVSQAVFLTLSLSHSLTHSLSLSFSLSLYIFYPICHSFLILFRHYSKCRP